MLDRMLVAVLALAALPAGALAQSEWLVQETGVGFEARRPAFDAELGLSAASAAYFLSARFQLSRFAVVGEIPFAYASYENETALGTRQSSDHGVGNLYFGVELPLMLGTAALEAGLRVPTYDADFGEVSPLVGYFGTLADRYDAFVSELLAPRLGFRIEPLPTDLIGSVRANAGIAYMMPGGGTVDADLVLDGGLRAFVASGGTRAGAGLEGMLVLTGDADLARRSIVQGGLWLDHDFGRLRPGLSIFLPLDDDYGDVIDFVLGLSLQASPR